MIKVYVSKQSAYPVATPAIKKSLQTFFEKEGIVSNADVTVALVGEKKMARLAEKYLKERGEIHNVLTFPGTEVRHEFLYPPGDALHLGEIVICYPKAVDEAKRENKLINQKVMELVEHGARHLMGIHHE